MKSSAIKNKTEFVVFYVYISSVSEESITNQLPDIPDDLIKSTAGAVRTLGRVFKKKVSNGMKNIYSSC